MERRPVIQLSLFYPPSVKVDGLMTHDGNVEYIGNATYTHGDGYYRAIAKIGGTSLCVMEVKLNFDLR